jgi:hypothetical protein
MSVAVPWAYALVAATKTAAAAMINFDEFICFLQFGVVCRSIDPHDRTVFLEVQWGLSGNRHCAANWCQGVTR